MKQDKTGCSTCKPGCEKYEPFNARGKLYVQYDYRTQQGKTFTCVAPSLEAARLKRDRWLNEKPNS